MRFGSAHLVAATAVTAALTLSACSGSSGDPSSTPVTSPATSPSTSTSASPSTSPATGAATPAAPKINPLTGLKPNKNGVVAVKIDDTSSGRPMVDIDQADNVFIEQVEGGLTRLLAIYNTHLPTVEAVRSTRASDPELVAPYGHIAYVASGGAHDPLKILRNSPLKTSINDLGGPGFQRDGSRSAPYNLRANLAEIAKKLKAPQAKPVGYQWSASTAQLKGAKPGVHIRTTVGSTPVAFDYSNKLKRYIRLINGVEQHTAAGKLVTASNVLVQFCSVTVYRKDTDVNGNPSRFTHTIGTGRAVMFRNSKQVDGTWVRKHYSGETQFTAQGGKAMKFLPGNIWTVLVAYHTPLSP